jgi:hypothetical protein
MDPRPVIEPHTSPQQIVYPTRRLRLLPEIGVRLFEFSVGYLQTQSLVNQCRMNTLRKRSGPTGMDNARTELVFDTGPANIPKLTCLPSDLPSR